MVEILNNEPDVKEVTGVEEAYVPLITLTFDGIEIDLLFGKVELPSVPESLDLCNDNLLKNLDDKNIRSLNGSRVTDEILRLVPDVQAFRITLRCIKLWAKRRAVYANIVGYLGGVAWAMLVARICQLFPNATSSSLVHKFFKVFSKWKWPEPVLLKPLEDGNLNLKVWNPKQNPSDKAHRMPIITPAYPSMCSTHNVSESTLTIMTEELARGFTIVENIMNGDGKWLTLFEKSDFFFKYKYYLTVNIFSTSQAIHLKWHGMVESRLRHLVGKLEVIDSIKLVHPYIKGFEEEYECVSEEHSIAIQKGLPFDKSKNTPPNSDGSSEPIKLWSTVFYMGILLETEKLNKAPGESKEGPKKMDISIPTNNFMSIVQTMDGYDVKNMKINIRMLKSSQLPDSLFSEDELKDRKRKSKSSGGKSKKSKVEAVTPSN
jgi:poly(A) polymerase